MNDPREDSIHARPSVSSTSPSSITPERSRIPFWQTLLGVAIPLSAIGFELVTHGCLEVLFDPIPTGWHALLVTWVPVAALIGILASVRGDERSIRRALRLIGPALGIASVYTAVFSPLVPMSLVGILFYGLGILALSPPLALIGLLLTRRALLRRLPEPADRPRVWRGFALGLAFLLLGEIPGGVVQYGLSSAQSDDRSEREAGIDFLRAYASTQQLRRALARGPGNLNLGGHVYYDGDATGFRSFSWGQSNALEVIFFRATGERVANVPVPSLVGYPEANFMNSRMRWQWDRDRGGEVVGRVFNGLELSGSRMDVSAFVDESVAYLEWTLVFENSAQQTAEARALLQLPPGAQISRATLWVDDEPREAVFGKTSAVRAAYAKVVRARRDPLLITQKGPGIALVQCFPVAADGGRMKIRLGVSIPIQPASDAVGGLELPRIAERNFRFSEVDEHAVWLEATRPPLAESTTLSFAEMPIDGGVALHARVSDDDLSSGLRLRFPADGRRASFAVANPFNDSGPSLSQRIVSRESEAPEQLILVVDASRSLRSQLPMLRETLTRLPASTRLSVIWASDEPVVLTTDAVGEAAHASALKALFASESRGGHDNTAGLLEALVLGTARPGSRIVWIHGPQPYRIQETESLQQWIERSPFVPDIVGLQLGVGFDALSAELERRRGLVASWVDLDRQDELVDRLAPHLTGGVTWRILREARSDISPSPKVPPAVAREVARLWAGGRVQALLAEDFDRNRPEAVEVAVHHRLVTSVSGAVVLETDDQYASSGLDAAHSPVEEGIPAIPEPDAGALLFLALVGISCARRSARRSDARLARVR